MNAETALSPQSPWPGLRAFQETDRNFFFGRDREAAELVTLIQRSTVVVLYGQSGLGKTSLLQAGVFHPIREHGLLPFRVRLEHGDSAPSLADQVKTALAAALNAASISGPRPDPAESLWAYFHRRDVELWGPRNRLMKPVIVLDQFEELFTLGQRSDRAVRRVTEFAQELEALLEHRAPDAVREALDARPDDGLRYDFQRESVKLIITLREDFLAQLDTWRTRIPSLLPNRFRLERMTGAQALDAVQRAGQNLVDPVVAQQIVDFVSRSQRRAQLGALEQRNVEPALLSVVCDELNRRRLEKHQSRITTDLLTGERQGIIQAFYNRAFEDVDPKTRDWIEDQLLTGSGFRDRAALDDALRAGVREADIDRLVDRRLVHREERDGVVWLELTHDLLTDPAFASRTERAQRHLAEEASRREAETAQRLQRTSRLAAVFGVLLVATVVALFFAFRMSARATDAHAKMQLERDRAVAAEANASLSAGRAQTSAEAAQAAAEGAKRSFDTAMRMAVPLGQSLRDFVNGDLRLSTSAVLEVIGREDDSYQMLASQNAAAASEQRADFLATAAESLFQIGHLTRAVGHAEEALTLLTSPTADPVRGRRLKAAALFAHGRALGATGRMAEARRDYAETIRLAQEEARATGWTIELVRLNVLSEIGLGGLDRWSLETASAESHYQRVNTFLNAHPLPQSGPLYDSWRVDAMLGLAANVTDLAEQDRRYGRADALLRQLLANDPESLRLQELNTALQYFWGDVVADLGRTSVALKLFQQGDSAATHLVELDRDNRQWKLLWIRTQRGTGDAHKLRLSWTAARNTFEVAEREAAKLLTAEPSWRIARSIHAALLWELGDTAGRLGEQTATMDYMQRSRDEFAAAVKRAPGDLDLIRNMTVAISGLAFYAPQPQDVLRYTKQALDGLAPLEHGAKTAPLVLRTKAIYLSLSADALTKTGNARGAGDAQAQRVSILEQAAAQTRLPSDYVLLADALRDLGAIQETDLGQPDRALSAYQRGIDAAGKAIAGDSASNDAVHSAALVRRALSDLDVRQKAFSAAFDQLRMGVDVVWNRLQREPWNAVLQNDIKVFSGRLDRLAEAVTAAGPQQSDIVTRAKALIADRQISSLVNWVSKPLMPGPWRNIAVSDLGEVAALVSQAYPKIKPDQVFAARVLPLEFRRDRALLVEAGVQDENGERGIAALVNKTTYSPDTGPVTVLDGTSPPVHAMNGESAPLLDTLEHATSYFRFFTGMLHGDFGPFSLVEKVEDVPWLPAATPAVRAEVRGKLQPLRLTRQPNGSWIADCTMMYSATLFRAQLTLGATALVQMDQDEPLSAELPVLVESIADGVRTLRPVNDLKERSLANLRRKLDSTPSDRSLIRTVVSLSAELHHWREAATFQQRLVDGLKNDLASRSELPGDYLLLAQYQLLARNFAGALRSADEARAAHPNILAMDAYRAHALLFLGRGREAEAIYRANIGKTIREGADKTWEAAVLDDFDLFERNGLTHPDLARLRKVLKPTDASRAASIDLLVVDGPL